MKVVNVYPRNTKHSTDIEDMVNFNVYFYINMYKTDIIFITNKIII